jgi:hypothetical protein
VQSNYGSAKERVHSALVNKERNDSSKKVFPPPLPKENKDRYISMYNKDFEGSYMPPLEPRPTSPTRRNNPHPTKQFMVWRVPSREIGGQFRPMSALGGPVRDDDSEFDDTESIYDRFKVPMPQPSSMEYGAYLREMRQRQQLQQQQMQGFGDRIPSRSSQRGDYYNPGASLTRPEQILARSVKPGNQDSLTEWLQTATPEEQRVVVKMLKEAEEGQLKQTIGQVMKPGAAKAMSQWLQKANDDEKDVATRLFSSLGSRSGPRPRSKSEPNFRPSSRRSSFPSPNLDEQKLANPKLGEKPWPKSLWHHLPVRDPPPRVYHRGSLFGKGGGGASHYTIHPEWPDYQEPTLHADIMH